MGQLSQGNEAHWEEIVARFGTKNAVQVRLAGFKMLYRLVVYDCLNNKLHRKGRLGLPPTHHKFWWRGARPQSQVRMCGSAVVAAWIRRSRSKAQRSACHVKQVVLCIGLYRLARRAGPHVVLEAAAALADSPRSRNLVSHAQPCVLLLPSSFYQV